MNYSAGVATFQTPRLICQSLSLEDYENFSNGIEPKWNGFSNPYKHLIEGPNPLSHRIPKVKANPNFAEIGLLLAILKNEKILIGSAGFHNFPNSDGMIEIGLGIVPEFQNQGYGKELLLGMWRKISDYPGVKLLRYTASPNNLPSIHIIESLNFKKIGVQMDEEDGLELIYEMTLPDYQKLHMVS